MSKAYIASGEKALILCSYDKRAGKALRNIGKLVDEVMLVDQNMIVQGINVFLDDDGYYNINATLSTTSMSL